jgi:hypothetical protein
MLDTKWRYYKRVDLVDPPPVLILREGFSWVEAYCGNGRWSRLSGIIEIDYPFADRISEAEAEDLIRQFDKWRAKGRCNP